MSRFWDSLQSLWRRTKPDETPEKAENDIPWLRVGILLRAIPFKKLLPVFISVPAVLFFTISGFVAWLVIFAKFVTSLFRM